jgi:ATP-dependent DNA helicase RecQ
MLRLYNDFQFDPEISRAGIGMYFGSSGPGKNWPTGELGDWKEYKKRITKEFKKGEKRILISTIAFGMGIDIPNIRYVVHYGISNSLEAWYQEAGRAGRNRLPSYVASVFSEEDLEGSNHLLVGEEKELRKRHSNLSNQWSDDVKVNLSFHWLSWKGILDELYLVKRLLNEIGQDNLDRKFRGNFEFKTSNTWQVGETSIPVEQLIYRLHIVGLVEDWQKNYGVKESTYFLTLKDRDTFLKFEQFRHWLKRRSPRDQNAIVETLVQLNNSEIKQKYFDEFSSLVELNLNIDLDQEFSEIYSDLDSFSSLLLSSVNIALHEIYTSVESARRRKVREIIEFSRNKVSNSEIHNGFEQYFTDGPAADLFRQLYDSQILKSHPGWSLMNL